MTTIVALASVVAGTCAARLALPRWYSAAVARRMRSAATGPQAVPEPPSHAPQVIRADRVVLEEVERGPIDPDSHAGRVLASLRSARRRRVALRSAALVVIALLQAVIVVTWLESASGGFSLRALIVAALLVGIAPALLAVRGLVASAQLSTFGSWWVLSVPSGAILGAAAWVTASSVGDVRMSVALVHLAVSAALCYVLLLLVLAALRGARRALGVSADGFALLTAGAAGGLLVTAVFGIGAGARGWSLLAVGIPVLAAAVLLPRSLTRGTHAPATLVYLRTFHGARSLLAAVSRHWLFLGEVHLLVGPDVATRTASAEGAFALATGRLGRHFVNGPEDLARRLAAVPRAPGRDGRFDVREFPCLSDTWRPTLTRLAARSDAILMDLRGFTASNAGCVFELQTLVSLDALPKTLLVVNDATELTAVRTALSLAAGAAPRVEPVRALVWTAGRGRPIDAALLVAMLAVRGRSRTTERSAARP